MDNENPTHQIPERKDGSNCNVSQTFNFTVGGISLIVAGIAAYLIYNYFIQG